MHTASGGVGFWQGPETVSENTCGREIVTSYTVGKTLTPLQGLRLSAIMGVLLGAMGGICVAFKVLLRVSSRKRTRAELIVRKKGADSPQRKVEVSRNDFPSHLSVVNPAWSIRGMKQLE